MSTTIRKLEIENVKRLTRVEIEPSSSVVRIYGQNANGKSSVLDAIAMALGGERLAPTEPIHRGKKSAFVRVDLSDGMVVTRRWKAGTDGVIRSKLEVTAEAADPETGELVQKAMPSPQGVLDKLIGSLSFDPESFARAEPKKQLATLKKITGVDFADLEIKRTRLFDDRAEVNREIKSTDGALGELAFARTPDPEVDVAALLAEQENIRKSEDERSSAFDVVAHLEQEVVDWQFKEKKLAEELEACSRNTKAKELSLENSRAIFSALPAPKLGAAEEVKRRILDAQEANAKVMEQRRQIKEHQRLSAQLQVGQEKSDRLTEEISTLDKEKERRVSAAQLPIPGLGFGAEGVLYQGLPLEQASSAEQIKVSMSMAMALNPNLRVVQVRAGSLLDAASLEIVQQLADANGYQVWLEIVGSGDGGVTIVDGVVEGDVGF